MIKRISLFNSLSAAFFTLIAIALVPAGALANNNSPKAEMNATLDALVDAVERLPGDDNKTKRRELMRSIIEPRFDFTEMARRSLGTNWKGLTKAERDEFVEVFSELLANTYLGRIDMIERGMVKVVEDRVHEDKAMIKTMVNYKGDKFGLDYRLLDRDGEWKVYDVIIENIGLVANYRNEFAGVIRKEKFSGLLQKLKDKISTKS